DLVVASEGDGEERPVARPDQDVTKPALVGLRRRDVGNLDRLARLYGTAHDTLAPPERHRADRLDERRVEVVRRAQAELAGLLVVLVDRAPVCACELACTGHDRIKHRLDIQRRADGATHLAERLELLD